jgi:hypothetical protein
MQNPVMLELDVLDAIIALPGEMIELALIEPRPILAGEPQGTVVAVGIEHDHVVTPIQRSQAGRQVRFLIEG